jgi:hypothetical protein
MLHYKRPKEEAAIIHHLETFPWVDEVIIQDHINGPNNADWGKFEGAMKARNRIVYTNDDDMLIFNIGQILSTWDGIHCSIGMRQSHWGCYTNAPRGNHCAFESQIAWGSFWRPEWIDRMDPYFKLYPEKDRIFLNQSERVFTCMQLHEHRYTLLDYYEYPSATGEMAMYRQDDYNQQVEEIRRRIRETLRSIGKL